MTNLGKWDYSGLSEACYSDNNQEGYKKAAEFLVDDVEDWGGGSGWAKQYFKKYKNIDGSYPKADVVCDLTEYTSDCKNILMRATLEYNENWKQILDNAKKSFREKMCLIIITPEVKKTRVGSWHKPIKADGSKGEGKIPEVYFNTQDILDEFKEYKVKVETIKTEKWWMYGLERIFYVQA
jgi:hypothetical protein